MTTFAGAHCATEPTETFFPKEADREGTRAARAICKGCPATQACLEFVMTSEQRGVQRHGIYAGLTPRQRGDLQRARAKAAS